MKRTDKFAIPLQHAYGIGLQNKEAEDKVTQVTAERNREKENKDRNRLRHRAIPRVVSQTTTGQYTHTCKSSRAKIVISLKKIKNRL